MDYLGKQINGRDIATVELLEEIKAYFSEDGAALNALALGGVSATSYALKTDVAQSIADLVGAAPDTLDTIEELATALKNNKDIVDTLDAAITAKANQSDLDDAVARILALEENPSLSAESIIEALGYTPADEDWVTNNFYNQTQIDEMLGDYLPTEGGWVDYIETGKVTSVEIEVETLTADAISINGDFSILGGNSLYVSIENYINGDQGGLYITSEAALVELSSRESIHFTIGQSNILSIYDSGGDITGDFSVIGSLSVEEDLDVLGALTAKTVNGYVLKGACSRGVATSVSSGGTGLVPASLLYSAMSSFLRTSGGVITGNLVIEGNLEVHGTSSSGGSAEVGDTALADLEARVAALESLIS